MKYYAWLFAIVVLTIAGPLVSSGWPMFIAFMLLFAEPRSTSDRQ